MPDAFRQRSTADGMYPAFSERHLKPFFYLLYIYRPLPTSHEDCRSALYPCYVKAYSCRCEGNFYKPLQCFVSDHLDGAVYNIFSGFFQIGQGMMVSSIMSKCLTKLRQRFIPAQPIKDQRGTNE